MQNEQSKNEEIVELHLIVNGHVQGVFFRATAQSLAKSLKITGTVRNAENGSVEIFAQGTRAQLERFIEKLSSENGPGRVDRLDKSLYPAQQEFSEFRIMR